MTLLPYSLQFRGYAKAVGSHVLEIRATAPGSTVITSVDRAGLGGRVEWAMGEEALLESRLTIAEDGALDASGTIRIGDCHLIRFRTLGTGWLATPPEPHLRQGSLLCEVESGEGQFAGAQGRIASNFVLSDSGDLTDNQFGLLFLAQKGAP